MSERRFASPPPLVGQSRAFLSALEHASAAAALDRPVLIIGERGTGKELIAARVHFLSARWDQPYVKVNCAALSEQLLDSDLFGHEAGAFTGATAQRPGRFERADGGAVFLDEIADAGLPVQEKILRIIEYGEFERLGGTRTLSVDTRVIAATNVDLPAKAAAGAFRADLLDRLAFDVITLPPLRARRDDIPVLAEHFARRMAAELGAERFAGFSADAVETLLDHDWPGNVRELKNVVERAVYRAEDLAEPISDIVVDPFASPWRPSAAPGAAAPAAPTIASTPAPREEGQDFTSRVAAFETALLREALTRAGGRQTAAAKALGLTYHQLRGLMRKHEITKPRAGRGATDETAAARVNISPDATDASPEETS